MSMWYDIDDVLNLFGISDSDIDAKATIEDAIYAGELSPISTKEVKYYDEEEQVWKVGSVIVDE